MFIYLWFISFKTRLAYFPLFLFQVSQAVAASGLPSPVWAVVDLYGKCAAVTLTDPNYDQVFDIYLKMSRYYGINKVKVNPKIHNSTL